MAILLLFWFIELDWWDAKHLLLLFVVVQTSCRKVGLLCVSAGRLLDLGIEAICSKTHAQQAAKYQTHFSSAACRRIAYMQVFCNIQW